jgi:hypothetical protein
MLVLNQPSFIGRNVLVGISQRSKMGLSSRILQERACDIADSEISLIGTFFRVEKSQIYIVFVIIHMQ